MENKSKDITIQTDSQTTAQAESIASRLNNDQKILFSDLQEFFKLQDLDKILEFIDISIEKKQLKIEEAERLKRVSAEVIIGKLGIEKFKESVLDAILAEAELNSSLTAKDIQDVKNFLLQKGTTLPEGLVKFLENNSNYC
ncbi:MAG: hypothetical protein Q7K42_02805, partial [Candidatus Diapherotrites archaeon]|nr:hypothetical protein [Candidatus Diapherotrites archaeon]